MGLSDIFHNAYDAGKRKYNEYAKRYETYKEDERRRKEKEAEHRAKNQSYYEEKLRQEKSEWRRIQNQKDFDAAERKAKWDAMPTSEKAKAIGSLGINSMKLAGAIIQRGGHEANRLLRYIDTNLPGEKRSLATVKAMQGKTKRVVKHRRVKHKKAPTVTRRQVFYLN